MKFKLKPIVSSVVLGLSSQSIGAEFEVVSKNDINVNKILMKDRQTINLSAGEFDPVFEHLQINSLKKFKVKHSNYGLVQLYATDKTGKQRIEKHGGNILGYLPSHTFVVKWNLHSKKMIEEDNQFRYVGNYQPAYKISKNLLNSDSLKRMQSDQGILVELFGFKNISLKNLKNTLKKIAPSAKVLATSESQGMPYMKIALTSEVEDKIRNLIQADDVMWIDKYRPDRLMNIDSVGPIQSNSPDISAATIWQKDILGTGQIVAVVDSGLDRNQEFFSQWDSGTGTVTKKYTNATTPPIGEIGEINEDHKVIAYYMQPGATPYDNNEVCGEDGTANGFHGTHVAGSVAGDSGTPANATSANYDEGDGMAPHAQILFQDIGNGDTGCLVSSETRYEMFYQARKAGAHISSHSYGFVLEDEEDGYFYADHQVDLASYELEDVLMIYAAGNDGITGLSHPGQAKNALTVGAVGHGDSNAAASFSSRGWAHDRRVKPDIMAPGVGIVSAAGNLDNAIPPTQSPTDLSTKSGTSMATPTVAGGTALMRQYFSDGFYPTGEKNAADQLNPSGSLLKSTLLNGTLMNDRTPSPDMGWGRIWLDNNLYFEGDPKALRVWDLPNSNGLKTGEEMRFKVNVEHGEAFRATLSWFDPPALFTSGAALVNNLDIEVWVNGEIYRGNRFTSGMSHVDRAADMLNNVEQVHIPDPEPGVYEVIVKGTSVNGHGTDQTQKQGFALVTSQAQCDSAVTGAPAVALSESDQFDPSVSITPLAGISDYQVYRKSGGCGVSNADYQFIGQIDTQSGFNSFIDQATNNGALYGYAVRGVDVCGEGVYSSCQEVVSNALCSSTPAFDTNAVQIRNTGGNSCSVILEWALASNSCGDGFVRYNIYRSTERDFNPQVSNRIASAVSGNAYSDLTVESGQMYHYIVTAVDEFGNESLHQNAQSILTTGNNFQAGDYQDDPDVESLAVLEDPWRVTSLRASTGNKSYHNAEDGFNYSANTCAFVSLPEIQLQNGASLAYDVSYSLEETWDGVVVQISTNGGSTWVDLPPNGGYPSSFASTEPTAGQPINACGFRSAQGAFSGTQNTFTTFNTDLSAYSGENVIIRWGFSSDPGAEEEGFYLDNINVTNASSPGVCEVAAINQFTSGPWFNPSQSGHGFFLELIQGSNNSADRLNSYWYTFLEGKPRWVFGNGVVSGDSATIDMYITNGPVSPPNYDINDLNVEYWGDLTFDFSSDIAGDISWNSEIASFGSGSMPINKLANVSDSPKACLSGSYSNAGQSGHGFVVEIVGPEGNENALISWYSYDSAGEQIWLIGQAPLQGDTASVPVSILSGADFPPDFDSQDVVNEQWGVLNLDFSEVNKMLVTWQTTYPGYENGQLNTDKFTLLKGKGCL